MANPCACYADTVYKPKKLKQRTLAAVKDEVKEGTVTVQSEGERFVAQSVRPTADFEKASVLVAVWWCYKVVDEGKPAPHESESRRLLTNEQEVLKQGLI